MIVPFPAKNSAVTAASAGGVMAAKIQERVIAAVSVRLAKLLVQ